MRTWLLHTTRWLLTLFVGLTITTAAIVAILNLLGVVPSLELHSNGVAFGLDLYSLAHESRMRWLAALSMTTGVSLLLVVAAVTRTRSRSPQAFTLKDSEVPGAYSHARVTLSRRGVLALVAHIAQSVPGVYDAVSTVSLGKDGWEIDCKISVWGDARLPELIPQLRERIKGQLLHHTGIHVENLSLHTQYEALTHSPQRLR